MCLYVSLSSLDGVRMCFVLAHKDVILIPEFAESVFIEHEHYEYGNLLCRYFPAAHPVFDWGNEGKFRKTKAASSTVDLERNVHRDESKKSTHKLLIHLWTSSKKKEQQDASKHQPKKTKLTFGCWGRDGKTWPPHRPLRFLHLANFLR